MSSETNVDLIRRQHDALARGDIDAAVDHWAQDSTNHGRRSGKEGVRAVLTDIHTTFPDWRVDIDDVVASGDWVVVRCTVTGTHRGVGKLPVNGGLLRGVPPTEKKFSAQHIHMYRVIEGHISEHWANRDDLSMMQQLGLLASNP